MGKRMLNPEVLKCHEYLITLETYVQQGKQNITVNYGGLLKPSYYICSVGHTHH